MGALVGGGIATVLTLMVLSRAIADNPLYRIAQYLLVGMSLGYAAAVLVGQALVPQVEAVLVGGLPLRPLLVLGVAGFLLLLLLTRFGRQRLSSLADLPLAVIFGVGAAIALVGAARGTLVPQLLDTIANRRLAPADPLAFGGSLVLIAAVVITLISFTFREGADGGTALQRGTRRFGRGLVLATFGVFLAAAVTTYITALVAQLQMMLDWINQLLSLF